MILTFGQITLCIYFNHNILL